MAKAQAKKTDQWPVKALPPPKLSTNEWYLTMALGVVFIVMAVTQLIGFGDFKDDLDAMGVASAAVWGTVLILGELWAAAGFFKLPLSKLFRTFSSVFAVLVSGFWFYEAMRLVSAGTAATEVHLGFFGRFLIQTPGWWIVVEATVLLFWTLWAVSLTNPMAKK